MADLSSASPSPPKLARRRSPLRFLGIALGALVLLLFLIAMVIVPPSGWGTREVATEESVATYPDLKARRYDVPPSMATTFAATFAAKKLGWRVPVLDPATNTAEILVPVLNGIGNDTLMVTAEPEGKGTRVNVRSRTGIGPGAPARNARHIRDLLAAMDDKLPTLP